jgi:farnesyl diphosphate synthase
MSSSDKKAVDKKAVDLANFNKVFPILADELLAELNTYNIPKNAYDWLKELLYYTVPGGKMNRGLSVVHSLRILKGCELTEEELFRSSVLGWAVEWLQAFFLVADDIMDQSHTRRNQPCWFRRPNVGNVAINDSFILESCVYFFLRKHFRSEPYYVDLLDLFHQVAFKTEIGQLLDLLTAPEDDVDLSKFSPAKHQFIVVYKTAYYSFYLPVALALLMHGVKNKAAYKTAEKILIPMGEYFQIQDDWLDCYGDPEFIGKIGTDIQDNKCSWLINQALTSATPDQRKTLDEHYGQRSAESEAKVKQIFIELDINSRFKQYEEDSYVRISGLIAEVDETVGVKKEVFTAFMDKIYKRSK